MRVPRLFEIVSRAPAASTALLVALLVQLAPLFFLGRPVGVGDIVDSYVPWRVEGAAPPANPLLDDAATGLHPWMAAFLRDGDLLAVSNVASGGVGPLAGIIGLLSPFVLAPFALLPRGFALTGMALLDLVFGFLAFYLWRRSRGAADLPAALGGAVWGFAPCRAVYRTWPFFGLPVLFPLLLWAVDRELDAPERSASRRGLIWAALTLVFVLGGHPSFALLGVDLAVFYAVARLVTHPARPPVGVLLERALAPIAGATAALLALAPVVFLGRAFLVDGDWLALRRPIATAPPLPWHVVFLMFDPSFYGDPVQGNWRGLGWAGPDNLIELQLYMGLVPLLLAPLGLLLSRRKERFFWAALALFVAAALLVGGPFAAAARLLPGISVIFLSRLRLVLLLAAAVLASLGLAAASRVRPLGHRLVAAGALLFTVLELSSADLRFAPFPSSADAAPRETPALARLRELAPASGRRFLAFGTAVPPNVAFDLGLEDVRAHQLFSAGYRRFLARLDPQVYGRHGTFLTFEPETFRPDAAVLDLLGVTALVAPPGSRAPGGDFRLDRAGADADVYARPWKTPARVVSREGASAAETGRVARFEAKRTSWSIEAESSDEATLLLGRSRLSAVDRVRVDGRVVAPIADARAEGLLAVPIPEGRHRVEVDAALPASTLVLSAVGFAALALAALHATLRASSR